MVGLSSFGHTKEAGTTTASPPLVHHPTKVTDQLTTRIHTT